MQFNLMNFHIQHGKAIFQMSLSVPQFQASWIQLRQLLTSHAYAQIKSAEVETDGLPVAKEVWETLWRNWGFIWALKGECNLVWQREVSKEKEQDMSWNFWQQEAYVRACQQVTL